MIARCCRVEGRVQGVFYRATTQRKAMQLAVKGYAKNQPDGSVEVWAEGVAPNVEDLCSWLWQGPEMAQVTDVACRSVDPKNFPDFSTS